MLFVGFFFFKQKTAYEMRISDWSSDVCSSDLIIMNNIATVSCGLPEDIPVEEWQRAFDVNLMSIVRSNHVFLPLFIAQGEGHIINTASVDGLFGFGYDRLPYAASKAAVVTLSEGLALYLRPKGIGVTCLCPGPVATRSEEHTS